MNRQHFWAVLWLRWRLSLHQWSHGGAWNGIFSKLMVVGLVLATLISFGAGYSGGLLGLSSAAGWIHLLIWDVLVVVFLFLWGFMVVLEVRRSESFDHQKLLHLPISPRHLFFMNYAASHVCATFLIPFFLAIGLIAGLATGRSLGMLVLLPLALGFFFMVSAWTYCLRGWLAALFMNQRRRNTALVIMVAGSMLFMQLPNVFLNVVHVPAAQPLVMSMEEDSLTPKSIRQLSEESLLNPSMLTAHEFTPLLWLPYGAYRAVEGQGRVAILGAWAAWLLGWLGMGRAYRRTIQFYTRVEAPDSGSLPSAPSSSPRGPSRFLEWQIPWVSPQTGALILANLRMIFRAPETRIMLIMPGLMTVLIGMTILRRPNNDLAIFLEPFLPAALTLMLLFGLIQLAMNLFGYDRSGFRALMLAPVSRREVLLAKNLSLFGLGAILNLALLALLGAVRGLSWDMVLAGLFQFITGFLFLSMVGNWTSVLLPYRIAPGTLKTDKMPMKVTALIFMAHTLFPVLLVPIFLPTLAQVIMRHFDRGGGFPISLLGSAALLATAVALYHVVLRRQSHLLGRRQDKVLAVVTAALD